MRYEQLIESDTQETELTEVRMGQSDLDKFVDSPEAEGIVAGFEAELCFPGLGESEIDYSEREEDMSEDRRSRSIENICDFYDDGDENSSRSIRELRESLTTDYLEWRSGQMAEDWDDVMEETVRDYIESNEWDFDEEVENYLRDELELGEAEISAAIEAGIDYSSATSTKQQRELKDGNEAAAHYAEASDHANQVLDDMVQDAIRNNDSNYDRAREQWEEQAIEDDDYSESRWLRSAGLVDMSDICNNYDITWPYWEYGRGEPGFNEAGADELEDSLRKSLGVKVHASAGYHSTTRKPGLWIIEPDGSLQADDDEDMPAEIVSPPYPLKECLDKMRQFFAWAKDDMSAYSNESTGLHVGISVPYLGGRVDYLKLTLLLGDEYVSDEFERVGCTYARNAIKKIREDITTMPQQKIKDTLELLRSGLSELAAKNLNQTKGHGKYTSINMKGDYIEFRSMGNNYMNKVDDVMNTVKRFAYVTYLASRPDLAKRDYSKKLYKMLQNNIDDIDENILQAFAQWSAGELTKDELKEKLKIRASQREYRSGSGGQWWWRVGRKGYAMGVEVVSDSEAGAKSAARLSVREWKNVEDDELTAKPVRKYTADVKVASTTSDTSEWPFDSEPPPGQEHAGWRIMVDGEEVHTFSGIGNNQGDANNFARRWVQSAISRGELQPAEGAEIEVLPIMRPVAQAPRATGSIPEWPFARAQRP